MIPAPTSKIVGESNAPIKPNHSSRQAWYDFVSMRPSLSLLAAVSRSQPSRLKKPAISLDHFIQRQRVLALWREIVRALNSKLLASVSSSVIHGTRLHEYLEIPPSTTRTELHSYARQEFERRRDVKDLVGCFSLSSSTYTILAFGKAEFDTMRRYIDEQVAG
ncbi:hypothetical protein N7466_004779 [Penicillium verhagenii]|uniref:uncharacterized protein n=1 Tax=Penicillium verhagenii TaxID=1562060 RepID=UPI002544EFB5|nr:uncharacterized protein N7466_004779 [Penicillium verhagenii]KAJ5935232.1 hypothetical protein N7466_004779 [Penicillium verhagenii]